MPGLACIATASPYLQGRLAEELAPAAVRNLGCLDVGFAVTRRPEGGLLDLHVGNHCKEPHPLDLTKLRIGTTQADGRAVSVVLHDPRHEIEKLDVGGCTRGHEQIRLDVGEGAELGPEVCLDVSAIAPDAPHAHPAPICLSSGSGT
ncbi:hypothetical protein [Pendulispora albinea]|uniref:Uncharacterized protein n=1 Tax=Pendulispora albinea TaxID=2741071 RepID=A0ABZ2MBJ5_9BACT